MKDPNHIMNNESVRVQITRGELISILIAIDGLSEYPQCTKYKRLRDKLRDILSEHDLKAITKGWRDV